MVFFPEKYRACSNSRNKKQGLLSQTTKGCMVFYFFWTILLISLSPCFACKQHPFQEWQDATSNSSQGLHQATKIGKTHIIFECAKHLRKQRTNKFCNHRTRKSAKHWKGALAPVELLLAGTEWEEPGTLTHVFIHACVLVHLLLPDLRTK